MVRSSYLCPTCLDHSVEVILPTGEQAADMAAAGIADAVIVNGECPAWGDFVTSITVPATQATTWVPWGRVLDTNCGDMPRWCRPCRKTLGV